MLRRAAFLTMSLGLIIMLLMSSALAALDAPLAQFATNTPRPVPTIATPAGPFERYGLRVWTEDAMIDLLLAQMREYTALDRPDAAYASAIRLTQIELANRFPDAPRTPERRAELLRAMIAVPGGIDLRPVLYPYLIDVLNLERPRFDARYTFERDGFAIELTAANLDSVDALDALAQLSYPAGAALEDALYVDYVPVTTDANGQYRLLPLASPARPLGSVDKVRFEGLRDVNGDTASEIVLSNQTLNTPNRRLLIYGWRGAGFAELTEPTTPIYFAQILSWPDASGTPLTVTQERVESDFWGCSSELTVSWRYQRNFFRPEANPGGFIEQDSLACRLHGLGNLFMLPPAEAIAALESTLGVASGSTAVEVQRARLVLAMLALFDLQTERAVETLTTLQADSLTAVSLARQAEVFLTAVQLGATPLQVCAQLVRVSVQETAPCDLDAALARVLTSQPLRRDQPIEVQLAALGITVLERQTVSEVGRLPREVVRFDLAGERWWAFAPLAPDVYTAEPYTPPGRRAQTDARARDTSAFDLVLDALANADSRGDLADVLIMLDNAARAADNAASELALFDYTRAMIYDLLADRTNARALYYRVWANGPQSIMGQLAAAHLELR